ncbi:uncharacterized protein LOC144709767 [Wolffia australiana]
MEVSRVGAEVATGNVACRDRSVALLKEMGLPDGLLPLEEIEEFGYVPGTGYVWLRQKRETKHTFKAIGKVVAYSQEVSGFVEKGRIRQLTGIKSKELLLWITVADITVDPADPSKISFKTPAGLFRTFPSSAFLLPQPT